MAGLRHLIAVLTAIQTCLAYADFYFASEASNWKCNALTFDCIPPLACVRDGLLNKTYCCGADDPGAICFGFSAACGANNKPLTGQIPCDTGDDAFCCLEGRELCTQRTNQINVCWATATNPYANVSSQKMNETFSSLTSAHPRQTTLAIDTVALLATASSASTTASSATTTSTSTSTSTSTQSSTSDSGLSGGAIGGIVVGAVAGLALIAIGAFTYWRRANKKTHGNEMDGTSNAYAGGNNTYGYGVVAQQEKYANRVSPQQQYSAPMELDTSQSLAEVEGSRPGMGMGAHPYR